MAISKEDYLDIKKSMGAKSAKEAVKASYDKKTTGPEHRFSIDKHIAGLKKKGELGMDKTIGKTWHKQQTAKSQALAKKGGGLRYKPAPMPKNYTSMSHEDRSNYYKKNKGTMVSDEVNPKTGKYYNTY